MVYIENYGSMVLWSVTLTSHRTMHFPSQSEFPSITYLYMNGNASM